MYRLAASSFLLPGRKACGRGFGSASEEDEPKEALDGAGEVIGVIVRGEGRNPPSSEMVLMSQMVTHLMWSYATLVLDIYGNLESSIKS